MSPNSHGSKNLTLIDRLARLCDPNSLEELFPAGGTVHFTASATIHSHKTIIISVDPAPLSEPPDLAASFKRYVRALDFAWQNKLPVIMLFDSPALYQSGKTAFQGANAELMMGEYSAGRVYYEIGRLLGRVPVLAAAFGNMAQAQAFPVAMCDALVLTESASLSIGRPDVVREMIGENLDYQELGGGAIHARESGTCDYVAADEQEAIDWLRRLLLFLLGQNKYEKKSVEFGGTQPKKTLASLIPDRLNKPYDARQIALSLVDDTSFIELQSQYAEELVVGFAFFDGMVAGLVLSNPCVRGGLFFPETCSKLRRFIDVCETNMIPMVFLADTPGFMIGSEAERAGIVRQGARLFERLARARCPRLCIILRRAYTAGLYAMSGSGFAPQGIYALPGAVISVYGPDAVNRFLEKLDLPQEQKEKIRIQMEGERNLENLVARGFLTGILQPEKVWGKIRGFLADH